jgi:hypothetical protein
MDQIGGFFEPSHMLTLMIRLFAFWRILIDGCGLCVSIISGILLRGTDKNIGQDGITMR